MRTLHLLHKLFSKTSPPPDDGFLQVEREALIDVLLMAMYADNHLATEELALLEREQGRLNWRSPTPPELFVRERTTKVREALADPQVREELLHSIQSRLFSPSSVMRAYVLCKEVLLSDGVQTDEETLFLETLRLYLGVKENCPK